MKKVLSSPLVSAANNIVSIGNASTRALPRFKRDFNDFNSFLQLKTIELERIKLPPKRKIRELANLNVASSFGRPGGLLGGLFSGALDVAQFLGDMFPSRGRMGKPQTTAGTKPPKPAVRGPKLKFGGLRSIGILNAVFAGVDFATGLQEGESVGKAAAGAGGALAGSLLGGAIGQALIPIPGLGFVIGSAAGGFLGGWGADRITEVATGGKGGVSEKLSQRLKGEEQKQKASVQQTSLSNVVDQFDAAVSKFEKGVAQGLFGSIAQQELEQPSGYDEELSPEEQPTPPDEKGGSVSYGSGNAEFGETGNVRNSAGWVHGHFQGSSPGSVVRDTTMVVKALLKQGSPVYLNPGVDLFPNKNYSDEEIRKYVENARKAHTHSGTGKSIDVFVKKGTKVPVALSKVEPTGSDYGGYGRGGIAGYIQGTDTWIGHLNPNSKSGLAEKKGEIKGTEAPNVDLAIQDKNTSQQRLQSTIQQQPQTKEQIEKPTDYIGEMNLQAPTIEYAKSSSPVYSQNVQYYPSYNQQVASTTIMPILMGSQGGQQKPVVIPVGGGGQGSTIIIPPPSEGEIVNSLMKTFLLTNLSAT